MPANNRPGLLEKLTEEANPEADTSEFTPTSIIRHRLLLGETVTRAEVEALGISRASMDMALKTLAACGWDYDRTLVDDAPAAFLVPPIGPPNAKKIAAYVAELSRKNRERAAEERKAEQKREAMVAAAIAAAKEEETAPAAHNVSSALAVATIDAKGRPASSSVEIDPPDGFDRFPAEGAPAVDSQLTVYLVARDLDGALTVGLRNGSRSWIATLTGMTAIES